jgi:signal transduction histidine kinase
MNEKIMETKREMSKLTDQLMASIDTYASYAEQKIEKMDQYVLEHEGKKLNDESILELKKLRYRIKDFQSIYNVSENAFRPKYESTSVEKLLKDAQEMAQADIANRNIDIQVEIDPEIPETISTDLNKLQQVILNLFLSSVNN